MIDIPTEEIFCVTGSLWEVFCLTLFAFSANISADAEPMACVICASLFDVATGSLVGSAFCFSNENEDPLGITIL